MNITGKNSLLYWIKYPFGIYTVGFSILSLWILLLMIIYTITGAQNRYISFNHNQSGKNDMIQFHYPFSTMVLSAENSLEGISLAFVGLISVCFILIIVFKISIELSKDQFFTDKAVRNFKILGFGLLCFGTIHFIIDLSTSSENFNLNPPLLFIITGCLFIFLKEIFAKGKMMQEENDLTI
nr:DUF2975 domain-containing protein [uncultured Chryseobacterium sp.]